MWAFVVVLGACTDEPVVGAFVLEPYLPEVERIVSVPVYGGTMESAPLVGGVVAADPEGNRLVRAAGGEIAVIDLGDNARPFRVHVEGTQGWVTLRGTGELVSIALDTMTVEWRTRVCPEPRGVTRSPTGALVVACAGGELVELDDAGNLLRLAVRDSDLRDVVVEDDHLVVSRFATAELLRIDPTSLEVVAHVTLGDGMRVAWRMRPHEGNILVLHQRATDSPVAIPGNAGAVEGSDAEGAAYGAGAGNPCGTIVDTVITEWGESRIQFNASLERVRVGTDFVVAPDGLLAVASAGAGEGEPDVLRFDLDSDFGECMPPVQERVLLTPGRASALALDVDGTVVVQSAAPFSLARAEEGGVLLAEPADSSSDALNLFHADPGAGVSCASCHPEGLDDGHVWKFDVDSTGSVPRRTMPLAGQILSRMPYHWDAAHESPDALMADTFVGRMGGSVVPVETAMLFDWLDGLRHVRAHPAAEESAIVIGRDAFAKAGCSACHLGAAFTNNRIEVTGIGVEPVKTPSLLGVGIRDDLLHDGCASDLDDRFDGYPCNREQFPPDGHGQVSVLTFEEIEALKVYLRTL